MCGFIGIKAAKVNNEKAFCALQKLSHRGPDEESVYKNQDVFLGHKRLVVVDKKNGKQPFCFDNLVMVYNGELYNTNELRQQLKANGHVFAGHSDTEVLIKMFAQYGEACLEKLNGIFSFAVYNTVTKHFFACRDRVGVKPLYYYHKNNQFMLSSEIKAILNYYDINQISINGLQQILGLGPSRSPGNGIYPNVHQLRPGHYLTYQNNTLTIKRYWNVISREHTHNFEQTVAQTRLLLEDSIKRQLVSDVPLCTLLSGGLDSTAITLIAKKYKPDLETYSIDYEDNTKFFAQNNFTVSQDTNYIKLVVDMYKLKHHSVEIDNKTLAKTLKDALWHKDYPGMVDIDSSLLWFSKQIKKDFTVALSGECADEIFGGYPWFYRDDGHNSFPWIRNLPEREQLLNSTYQKKLDLKGYVEHQYTSTLKELQLSGTETEQQKRHKQMLHLNMNWFMPTLLDRKDRMTMAASLEVRVPFADHRLIEYLYNVPWEYKFHNNMEKGLLRMAVADIVPYEIVNRKKNPYPKTHNPIYLQLVSKLLAQALKSPNSVLHEVFDSKVLTNLLQDSGQDLQTPWFGQLMTKPQLIAFLYQFDLWFKTYNLTIV